MVVLQSKKYVNKVTQIKILHRGFTTSIDFFLMVKLLQYLATVGFKFIYHYDTQLKYQPK